MSVRPTHTVSYWVYVISVLCFPKVNVQQSGMQDVPNMQSGCDTRSQFNVSILYMIFNTG